MCTPAARDIAGLELAAVSLGVVATLGTGFVAWGGMDQRLATIEAARDRKPDRLSLSDIGWQRICDSSRFDHQYSRQHG